MGVPTQRTIVAPLYGRYTGVANAYVSYALLKAPISWSELAMRKLSEVLATGIAGVVLSIGFASEAQASPWEFAGAYSTDAECQAAGQHGMATGKWQDYQCALFEGVYDLYVREQ
ncbi:hypothetical protein [Micromonospora echinaurantiaca]|uniref:hypothetical protein n=1 Tax=Micromonospora echinaurantiaca TaxID=47857 RepID=UPI0012FD6068|nr:hypothetical protein [Micromonospora echinaurantiaca]